MEKRDLLADGIQPTATTAAAGARALLGLGPPPGPRDGDLSVSATSSADSADVAGGRVGARPGKASVSTRDGVPKIMTPGQGAMDSVHHHLHPSRALWEGQATPSPSPLPPPGTAGSTNGFTSTNGSGRRPIARSGGREDGRGSYTTDTFWSPILPESGPAPPVDASRLGHRWGTWGQQEQQEEAQGQARQSQRFVFSNQPRRSYGIGPPSKVEQQLAAAASGGIDRPALRGQEYRRQKKRKGASAASAQVVSNQNGRNNRPSSSLMRSGSELDGQAQQSSSENDAKSSKRFLGIPWPWMKGAKHDHSEEASCRDESDTYGGGDEGSDRLGQVRGNLLIPEDSPRLQVLLDGTEELGKGLSGHTAYRIQVSDTALGEQWVVLRRFRQFEDLHQGLLPVLSKEPDATAYALPPKELFGGRHGGVIAKRLKLLKVYLDRLVSCSAAVEHRSMTSFLELDPALRGLGSYGRQHGPECIFKEGQLRVKEWKGPYKPVINMLEAGLGLIGWTSAYAIVSPGPVFLVYYSSEDNPEKPVWVLPGRRTVGSQVRVRRVDMWKADLDNEGIRFFLVSWETTSLLCQVDSEASLDSWAHALDESVDLRPQQSEDERAKVDIELKAKEAWATRENGLWGGL